MKTVFFILILMLSPLADAAWSKQDVALAVKLNKYSNEDYVKAMDEIEWHVQHGKKFYQFLDTPEMILNDLKEDYPPANFPSYKGPSLQISATNPQGVGVSTDLFADDPVMGLGSEARRVLMTRAQNLRDIYNSPNATEFQKKMIAGYLQDYLNISPTATEDDLKQDMDLVEIEAIYGKVDISQQNLANHSQTTLDSAVLQMSGKLKDVQSEIKKDLAQEAAKLKGLTGVAIEGIQDVQVTVHSMQVQDMIRDLKGEILKEMNYSKMDKMIAEAQQCQQTNPSLECDVRASQLELMKKQREYSYDKAKNYAINSSLAMAQGLASMLGDQKLAGDIGKVMYAVQTGQKMADLAMGLAAQGALSMMGDVTSMAGMAMSVVSMFGGGGGSDEAIMAELQAIKRAIEQLRVEMHERFNQLSAQVQQLGIGLNAKIDAANMNIGVAVDNQMLLNKLLNETKASISHLTYIQSSDMVRDTLFQLTNHTGAVALKLDSSALNDHFSSSMVLFNSFLNQSNALDLLLPGQGYAVDSEYLAQMLVSSRSTPQKNMANFSVIDYLIKSSMDQGTSQSCVSSRMTDIFYFNVLAEALLPIFRAQNPAVTQAQGYKAGNKYLNYIETANIDALEAQALFDIPLQSIDSALNSANNCLNNYRQAASVKVNVISFLIMEYQKAVTAELDRILNTVQEDNHLKIFQKAINDVNQGYFSDMDKQFMHITSDNIDLRKQTNIAAINYLNEKDASMQTTADLFFDNYHKTSACSGFENEFPTISIPRVLLDKIFNKDSMKLGLRMGFSKMSLCYYGYSERSQNPGNTSPLYLRISYTGSPDVFFDVPLFVSAEKIGLRLKVKIVHDNNEPGKHGNLGGGFKAWDEPHTSTIESWTYDPKVLENYFLTVAPATAWQCGAFAPAVDMCWPEGLVPTQFTINYQTLQLQKLTGLKKSYFDTLLAPRINEVFNIVKSEVSRCYRNILLGQPGCTFGEFKSYEATDRIADFSKAQKIHYTLKALTPLISSFRESVPLDQRNAFAVDFGTFLPTPYEFIIDTVTTPGDIGAHLKKKTNKLHQELTSLSERANRYLYVDVRDLLETETYDAFRFYGEQTRAAFKEKTELAKGTQQ